MTDDKLRISWNDIDTVPDQVAPVAEATGSSAQRESWGHLGNSSARGGQAPLSSVITGSILNRTWFYLGLAGLIAGTVAWGLQEVIPLQTNLDSYAELEKYFEGIVETAKRRNSNWERMSQPEQEQILVSISKAKLRLSTAVWFALIGAVLATGLGMAEGIASRSGIKTTRGGIIGIVTGAIGGFLAGLFAQWLYTALLPDAGPKEGINATQVLARTAGWALAGGLVGSAFGLAHLSPKRCLLGIVGGLLGGAVGGVLFDTVAQAFESAVAGRCVGIISIGLASGLLISAAEQVAKSAWVQIQAGRLIGKQFVIYRNPTRIGALAANDIYLFKDTSVGAEHAQIQKRGNGYFIVDLGTPTGTRVNGRPIREARLSNGDSIQIGETVLLYGERS